MCVCVLPCAENAGPRSLFQSINIAANIAAATVPNATVTVTPALSELELLPVELALPADPDAPVS